MTIGPPAAFISESEQFDSVVAVDSQFRIIKLAVKLRSKGCLAQSRTDAFCNSVCVHAVFILTDGAVREGNVYHFLSPKVIFKNKTPLNKSPRTVIPRFHLGCRNNRPLKEL